MKKYLAVLVLIFSVGVIMFFNIDKIFTSNKEIENVRNSSDVRVGISEEEVIQIMGKADQVQIEVDQPFGDKLLFYKPPFGASQGIEIYIDTNNNEVVRIVPYE